jgi:elongation factor Ts
LFYYFSCHPFSSRGKGTCKPEPLEANGDQEATANALCKKGLAVADKKATCVAAEGRIAFVSAGHNKAAMVKLNCETDFVRNDSSFLEYCGKVADAAVNVDDNNDKALTSGETLEW